MIAIVLEVAWYIELAGATWLVGMGVLRVGQKRKRKGWTMLSAGIILMTLFAIFGPDIIIEMQ